MSQLDVFEIFVDRLRAGKVHPILGPLDPSFLEVVEPDLQFSEPVQVHGEAYLTDSHLIIHLKAATKARMPCTVCNQMIPVDLRVDHFYHTQPLNEIPSGVFNFREQLREAILIELPKYVECNGGKCKEREALTPFLRSKSPSEKTSYFPFADVDLN